MPIANEYRIEFNVFIERPRNHADENAKLLNRAIAELILEAGYFSTGKYEHVQEVDTEK